MSHRSALVSEFGKQAYSQCNYTVFEKSKKLSVLGHFLKYLNKNIFGIVSFWKVQMFIVARDKQLLFDNDSGYWNNQKDGYYKNTSEKDIYKF